MRRSEWIRVGAASGLACMLAFGMGAATGGRGGASTASVVPTSPGGVDVKCMGQLRDDAYLGLRLLPPGVPRFGCEQFDVGVVALAFMDAIVFECERSLVDGSFERGSRPGACVGVSRDELVRLGVAVHHLVAADPALD